MKVYESGSAGLQVTFVQFCLRLGDWHQLATKVTQLLRLGQNAMTQSVPTNHSDMETLCLMLMKAIGVQALADSLPLPQ